MDGKTELYTKLAAVQRALKAPKAQRNSFGNYNYRSCEDILEAAKPLCCDTGLLLTISDEIVFIEGRFYVKATAKVIDVEDGKEFSTTALAREAENKKGMDESQLTGACSSYARKYALSGLFCLDDTKDADTSTISSNIVNNGGQKAAKPASTKKPETVNDYYSLVIDYARKNNAVAYIVQILKSRFNKAKFTELSLVEAKSFYDNIEKLVDAERKQEAEDDKKLMEGIG